MNLAISFDLTAFSWPVWCYHPRCIEFQSKRILSVSFCYFCKKYTNCNSNIKLKITCKAIKCFLVSPRTTYVPQGEEQLIWNQSCPCLAIWYAEAMENDQTNSPRLSRLFSRDKKIALHYILLSSLGCESQWQMSLSFKRAKHMWDWLL